MMARHLDCEQMRDGTRRWLWRVMLGNNLWRAGVASSLLLAEVQGHRAMRSLEARMPAEAPEVNPTEGEPDDSGGWAAVGD